MKNYVQIGQTITIFSPAGVLSGGVVIAGSFAGIACGDAEAGAPLDLRLEGVFDLPKVAADAVTVGAPIFWDATAALATIDDDEGANARLGTATQAAPAGSATARVRLVQV